MENIIDFLTFMYQNAEMGIIGIDDVYEKAKSNDFRSLLLEQKKDYEILSNEIKELLKEYEINDVSSINAMAKIGSMFTSSVEIAKDHKDSTIARLMIEGTNKGIIKITERLNNTTKLDSKSKKIAKKLLKIETNNLNELKKYL